MKVHTEDTWVRKELYAEEAEPHRRDAHKEAEVKANLETACTW